MQSGSHQDELEAEPAPETMKAAIQRAEAHQPPAYFMRVSCVDEKGPRSLRVLPSGTAILNRATQVVVPPAARSAYLAMLKRADYPTMAKSYGGPGKGALRIRCEVAVELDGVEKTSVQLAGGEQSPRVEGLAREILDYTESLGLEAEPAESLSEALQKWVSGQLNADTLNLRILQLPSKKGIDGSIVEVRRGEVSRRRYAPGRGVKDGMNAPLDREELLPVLHALIAADFEHLPANLMASEPVEVEVAMLGHRKKVIARGFGRPMPAEAAAAQGRFDKLLVALRAFTESANAE